MGSKVSYKSKVNEIYRYGKDKSILNKSPRCEVGGALGR